MSLTDEQIDALDYLVEATGYCSDNLGVSGTREFARAIESAATAPLLERIAVLERELEAVCKDAGGTPVWNGSFQECIYKDRKNVTP